MWETRSAIHILFSLKNAIRTYEMKMVEQLLNT